MATIFAQGASSALRAISTFLPKHTQRLVLWCTLYGKMCGAHDFTKEQCENLNSTLILSKDNSALALPAKLGRFIWSDLDDCSDAVCKAIRNEKSFDAAALEFIRSIPAWLRYASDAFIVRDLQSLMNSHQRAAV